MVRKFGLVVVCLLLSPLTEAAEVGLVTSLAGTVTRLDAKAPGNVLKPFVKVWAGDRLTLGDAARVQIVYFDGGRQETWSGAGAIAVGESESVVKKGKLVPEIKVLPALLVKQLAKTPGADGNLRAGMVRSRSIPPPKGTELAEQNYAELRANAPAEDRSPELYLLASYLELREFEKLDGLMQQLKSSAPADAEIEALCALYTRAAETAKSGAK